MKKSACLLTMMIAASTDAVAGGVPESLRACTREADDARRLACFDSAMRAADADYGLSEAQRRRQEQSKATTPASTAADAAAPVAAPPPPPRQKPQASGVSSTVAAVTLRPDGRKTIDLQNGQTWVQGDAFDPATIHVGDIVTIKSGALGALFLYLPNHARTRVTRQN